MLLVMDVDDVEPVGGLPAAAVPTYGVDPRTALASTLHSAGTTAVLLGSGVSTSAGILTGWEVTQDLIRRIAVTEGVPSEELRDSPADWWVTQGRGQPRYDLLLEALAPMDFDRRVQLRRYFDSDPRTGFDPKPTHAHLALARLAKRGSVPVILTTNFDRLLERALEAEGVAAQILIEPSAVRGMTPLPHAGVTVVKLHGDYAGGRLLNSPDELANYDPAWTGLLQRVFDEYGLLVVGWSGEYDLALAAAMAAGVGRRYAWYRADYRGQLTVDARRLVAGHGAHVITTTGADEFFRELEARLAGLDQVAGAGALHGRLRRFTRFRTDRKAGRSRRLSLPEPWPWSVGTPPRWPT